MKPSAALVVVLALAFSTLGLTAPIPDADSDGDRIPDAIETASWYIAEGGSVDRKDIWVECDFMRRIAPSKRDRQTIVETLREIFDRAPVTNPGAPGIALHLAYDDAIPFARSWGNLDAGPAGQADLVAAVEETGGRYFDAAPFSAEHAETMQDYVHYCAVVNSIAGGRPGGTSGISLGGRFFAVSLGAWAENGTPELHIGTMLHELGHSLGLEHGGADPGLFATFKPNYLSVMNYHFQGGLVREREDGTAERAYAWDYSSYRANTINELNVDEYRGVRAPRRIVEAGLLGMHVCGPLARPYRFNEPVDWDCDGVIEPAEIADTNGDGETTRLAGTTDWDKLQLGAGASGVEARTGRSLRDELDEATSKRIDDQLRAARLPERR